MSRRIPNQLFVIIVLPGSERFLVPEPTLVENVILSGRTSATNPGLGAEGCSEGDFSSALVQPLRDVTDLLPFQVPIPTPLQVITVE